MSLKYFNVCLLKESSMSIRLLQESNMSICMTPAGVNYIFA